MSSRWVAGALGAAILGGAIYVGARPIGALPPLGGLLNPATGVWALAGRAEHAEAARAAISSLGANVDVRYDDRGVPHIFAGNELDAIRALGYVVASDRLFQLELQTRAAAGTLTELVGSRALDADRTARRIGLPWGAHRKFTAVEPGSMAMRSMQAYADGVNAYIDQMTAADLPIEYRLLNKKPQRWQPENTMLLLVRMGYTLAWSDFEMRRVQVEARVGRAATDALFPRDEYLQEPIHPNGQHAARTDPIHLPPPKPDSAAAALAKMLANVPVTRTAGEFLAKNNDIAPGSIGSNNWAVAPSRSENGHALLANDPHLDLSLPSTWYEAHLVVHDTIDVYGVTFPGAPSIVLGVNRDVAWGATNVGGDVADYYLETVDNAAAPTKYRVDTSWINLARSIEAYRDTYGHALSVDTLYFTHRGPMFRAGDTWISRRWLVLEPSQEFDAFRLATRAHSVREFFDALRQYESPAQNFVAADRGGHIGIQSTGDFPVRAPNTDGTRFIDGSKSKNDWNNRARPLVALQTIDPAQGFVASANQQPVDPRVVHDYLGNDWPTPWRAMRINTLLRADSAVTPVKMRLFQTDPGNARADAFVPMFLAAVQTELRAGHGDETMLRAAKLLGDWDHRYTPDNQRAVLFEAAMRELTRETWDELAADTASGGAQLIATPEEHVLYALTQDPTNLWWDRLGTPAHETRDAVLASSLRDALDRVERERGPVAQGKWRWSRIRMANIWHPLRIPALSALNLPLQGGRESLNPSSGSGTHGSSWRLVVDLGPTIRAWGTYPGGQSANPVSSHYRDRVETWRRGELDSLRIPTGPNGLGVAHSAAKLTLVTGKN